MQLGLKKNTCVSGNMLFKIRVGRQAIFYIFSKLFTQTYRELLLDFNSASLKIAKKTLGQAILASKIQGRSGYRKHRFFFIWPYRQCVSGKLFRVKRVLLFFPGFCRQCRAELCKALSEKEEPPSKAVDKVCRSKFCYKTVRLL